VPLASTVSIVATLASAPPNVKPAGSGVPGGAVALPLGFPLTCSAVKALALALSVCADAAVARVDTRARGRPRMRTS